MAAIAGVRAAPVDFQRQFAHIPPDGVAGAGLDGYAIGGSQDAKVERRFRQLHSSGAAPIKARVLADLQERDQRDSARSLAPLAPAADAFRLDTTSLNADQAFDEAVAHIEIKRSERNS